MSENDRACVAAFQAAAVMLRDPAVNVVTFDDQMRAAMRHSQAPFRLMAGGYATQVLFGRRDFAGAAQWIRETLADHTGLQARNSALLRVHGMRRLFLGFEGDRFPATQDREIDDRTPSLHPLTAEEERHVRGATCEQLAAGIAAMSTGTVRERGLAVSLQEARETRARLTGTLVRDARGRFGVVDETTGRVTAVYFELADSLDPGATATSLDYEIGLPLNTRSFVTDVIGRNEGSRVRVEGTVLLTSPARAMVVTAFTGSEQTVKPAQLRQGLRLLDREPRQAADIALWRAAAGRSIA
jgi:hypothetical protein